MATDLETTDRKLETQTAYLILVAGGLAGGILVLAALVTSWWWWGPFLDWLREGSREKLWQPLLAIVGLLAGLAVMFAAAQSARRFERVDVTLRRVLYGYNALLQVGLLGLLLVVVCVYCWHRYPLPYDTTEGGFYSLGERTKQFIAALEKPVEVYMLLSPEDPDGAYDSMKTVLEQMQSLNPRYFTFEEVAVDGRNNSRIRDLMKRFKQFSAQRPGVLVAYGARPEENHSYISASELVNLDFGARGEAPRRSFNGEVRLLQELTFLGEDKRRPIVYVTQNHGEPDMTDHSQDGLSSLVQRLSQANYDVRPLTPSDPDPQKNAVPENADVVLVVGPRRPMGDVLPALERYLNPTDPKAKKGKLVALLGPTGPDRQRGNRMVETGLEATLRKFGVNPTGEQVLMLFGPGGEIPARGNRPFPEAVIVGALRSAAAERHPLAMLAKDEANHWIDVRHIEVSPGAAGPYRAEPLLATAGFVWLEADMGKSSLETWGRLRNDPDELRKRVKREPLPAVIAVSESSASDDPHAALKPNQGATPRMVVFGCATIATNANVRPGSPGVEFDLIRGSLDWCRERYTQIGVEPKSYRYFALPQRTSYANLFYLPLAAMALGVCGLGLIVWNIRRG